MLFVHILDTVSETQTTLVLSILLSIFHIQEYIRRTANKTVQYFDSAFKVYSFISVLTKEDMLNEDQSELIDPTKSK